MGNKQKTTKGLDEESTGEGKKELRATGTARLICLLGTFNNKY